jgi:hypothetical protein
VRWVGPPKEQTGLPNRRFEPYKRREGKEEEGNGEEGGRGRRRGSGSPPVEDQLENLMLRDHDH